MVESACALTKCISVLYDAGREKTGVTMEQLITISELRVACGEGGLSGRMVKTVMGNIFIIIQNNEEGIVAKCTEAVSSDVFEGKKVMFDEGTEVYDLGYELY